MYKSKKHISDLESPLFPNSREEQAFWFHTFSTSDYIW